jgi:kynurenine formamidase
MIIDLSMPVNEQTVVYPGDAKPVFEQAGTMEKDGFVDHVIHINNHLGTHIDGSEHMVNNSKKLSEFPVDRFVSQAVCIDARGKDPLDISLLDGVEVPIVGAVLFYTGTGDRYTQQDYATDHPAISQELAKLLVDRGVKMVGIDMISFDLDQPFPIHKLLLGNDVLLIENLINLEKVSGKKFKLYALPVNLELEAAPARVIAEL